MKTATDLIKELMNTPFKFKSSASDFKYYGNRKIYISGIGEDGMVAIGSKPGQSFACWYNPNDLILFK